MCPVGGGPDVLLRGSLLQRPPVLLQALPPLPPEEDEMVGGRT